MYLRKVSPEIFCVQEIANQDRVNTFSQTSMDLTRLCCNGCSLELREV